MTPEQLLNQYGVTVEHNLNETYDLTGANVQFVGMVGIVVTVLRADGTPAVGSPVVINVFPDGHGDEPATPDGAGQVKFSAAASSAYTPPQRGPFTVTLCESAVKDPDTHTIQNTNNLSPSIQGMGDYLANHTLWSLQFREKGTVVTPPPPPPPPPSGVPVATTPDEIRTLAYGMVYPQGIRFLNTAALVVYARKKLLGVAVTNEGRFQNAAGELWDIQGFTQGIVITRDGHYADSDFVVVAW